MLIGEKLETTNITNQPQANGWWLVEFTLHQQHINLPLGARLQISNHLLAIWRIRNNRIFCLAMPSKVPPDTIQPIYLLQEGNQDYSSQTINNQQYLVIGKDLGIADALLYCQQNSHLSSNLLILLSADSFPFIIKPAKFMVSLLPEAIGACPLLEDWGVANRLFSQTTPTGCYDEDIETWLKQQSEKIKHFEMIKFQ